VPSNRVTFSFFKSLGWFPRTHAYICNTVNTTTSTTGTAHSILNDPAYDRMAIGWLYKHKAEAFRVRVLRSPKPPPGSPAWIPYQRRQHILFGKMLYSSAPFIVGVSLASSLFCEGVLWLLVYRTVSYQNMREILVRTTKKGMHTCVHLCLFSCVIL
jgi:hypothetical protein